VTWAPPKENKEVLRDEGVSYCQQRMGRKLHTDRMITRTGTEFVLKHQNVKS